jgi:hypothetical protein
MPLKLSAAEAGNTWFRGFISRSWGSIVTSSDSIPSTLRTQNHCSSKPHPAPSRLSRSTQLAIWTGRNDMLHSNTVIPTTIHESRVILKSRRYMHFNLPLLHVYKQLYFQQPLTKLLGTSYHTRQQWLIITKLATAQQCQLTNGQRQTHILCLLPSHRHMTFACQHANTPQPPITLPYYHYTNKAYQSFSLQQSGKTRTYILVHLLLFSS